MRASRAMATAATARAEPAETLEPAPEERAVERAREVVERYGDHADAYVASRIEASRTSGEPGDVAMWERAAELISGEEHSSDD
jgi:hypothetical protein